MATKKSVSSSKGSSPKPSANRKPESSLVTELETALEALGTRDLRPLFLSLLAAWKKKPAAELRALLGVLDKAFPTTPFEGETADWIKAAAKKAPESRSALLASLRHKVLEETRQRMAALSAWEPDPRCSEAIEAFLREIPYTSNSSKPVWNAVFEVMVSQGDPRFPHIAADIQKGWTIRSIMRDWLCKKFSEAVEQIPTEVPVLSTEEAALVKKMAAAVPKPKSRTTTSLGDESKLFAAVYDSPEDDGPRLVLSDFLQEKGDPRGEFIMLQLKADPSRAEQKRATELFKQHGLSWLGPLGSALKTGAAFRRGFPAAGEIKCRNEAEVNRVKNLAEWSTFEELAWTNVFFIVPPMRWAKKGRNVKFKELLKTGRAWGFEQLEGRSEGVIELLNSGLVPELRILETSLDTESLERITRWGKLETFISSGLAAPKLFLPAAAATPLKILELDFQTWKARFERGTDGRFSLLKVSIKKSGRIGWLSRIPAGYLERLDVDGAENLKPAERIVLEEQKCRLTSTKRPATLAPRPLAEQPHLSSETKCEAECAFWTPSNEWLLVAKDRILRVDAQSHKVTDETWIDDCVSASFTADGQQVLVVGEGWADVREVATGRVLKRLPSGIHGGAYYQSFLTRDGRLAAINHTLISEIWDLETMDRLCQRERSAIQPAPDGAYWADTAGPDHTITITWRNGAEVVIAHPDCIVMYWMLPLSNGRIMGHSGYTHFRFWDSKTGAEVGRTPLFRENRERGYVETPDGKQIIVLPTEDDGARELIVIPTASPEAAIAHPVKIKDLGIWPLCFSPDQTKLLVRLHTGVSYSRDGLGILDLRTYAIETVKV